MVFGVLVGSPMVSHSSLRSVRRRQGFIRSSRGLLDCNSWCSRLARDFIRYTTSIKNRWKYECTDSPRSEVVVFLTETEEG